MSLQIALDNALSGLSVNRKALEVLSNNIANANTPGYTAKKLNLASNSIDGIGNGVSIADVTRKVDDYLKRQVQQQNANVAKTTTISDYNDRVQILLGKPGADNSIDSYVGNFFNSLQLLAETPERPSLRTTAVNSGATLSSQVSQLAGQLEDLRYQADRDVKTSVDQVNKTLNDLYNVNVNINANTVDGKPVADLLDKRDNLLKDLSDQIDVQYYFKADGEAQVSTAGGVSLLDDSKYQLSYTATGSASAFSDETPLYPITVTRLDLNNKPAGAPQTIVSAGKSTDVVSSLHGGKLQGLIEMRDKQIPDILAQLDQMSAQIRDAVNTIHNQGSPYPGNNVMTGTRDVYGENFSEWTGSVRIAVLDAQGNPLPSQVTDATSAQRPLNLDLSKLDSGFGAGRPTMQSIVDSINDYYAPKPEARVGLLNNIKLVSNTKTMPDSPPVLNFDFNLENISGQNSQFWVSGVTVKDDTGADITSVTSTKPSIALAGSNTFVTNSRSSVVTVNTAGLHGLSNGDTIYLGDPGTSAGGITHDKLAGYFKVSNVTGTSFTIDTGMQATSAGPTNVTGLNAQPKYTDVPTGGSMRTSAHGTIAANLSGNPSSTYYTVTAQVGVLDKDGQVQQTSLSYRVYNNDPNMLNMSYGASALTGSGTLAQPTTSTPVLTAKLIDDNGNELPKVNGRYVSTASGHLQLAATDPTNNIVIDELDSKQTGFASQGLPGSNWGFSHFFGLNNFFADNKLSATGDTVHNSALNMKVDSRLLQNANYISTGKMEQSAANADGTPNYTYSRSAGANSIIQQLAKLGNDSIDFSAAGGLLATTESFNSYAGDILGSAASNASTATSNQTNAQLLLDGFSTRSDSISGVNMDTELANTIIYQNAYAASARIITTTKELYDTLLQATQ